MKTQSEKNQQAHLRRCACFKHFNFYLPLDMDAELRAKAKAKGLSIGELIRTYIEWGLENDHS